MKSIITCIICTMLMIHAIYPGGAVTYFRSRRRQANLGREFSRSRVHESTATEPTQNRRERPSIRERSRPAGNQRNIILKTEDGLERKAILTINDNAKGNVVLCHPAAYDKEFMKSYEEKIFAEYNTVRFDFRRHGEDTEDQYTTFGRHEVFEVNAAVAVFKNNPRTAHLPTYGFGISMGAATLIEAENKTPMFDALILQAPFENIKNQVCRLFPLFHYPLMRELVLSPIVNLYAQTQYHLKLMRVKPVKSISTVTAPILLIHAENDQTVCHSAFEKLKRAGKSIRAIWTPATGGHTGLFSHHPEKYKAACLQFLEKLIKLPRT